MKAIATHFALFLLLLSPLACQRFGGGSEAAAPAEDLPLERILQLRDEAEAWFAGENARIAPLLEADPGRYAEETERIAGELQQRVRPYGDRLAVFLKAHPENAEARKAYASYLASFVAPRLAGEEGNYREAAAVYREALTLDPGNAEIETALEEARELSFMTRERFSSVDQGMPFAEVQEICGIPSPAFIRREERAGRTLTAWYYPTEDWGAAGFFFADGQLYAKEFAAIPAKEVRRLAASRAAESPGGAPLPAAGVDAGADTLALGSPAGPGAETPATEAPPTPEGDPQGEESPPRQPPQNAPLG